MDDTNQIGKRYECSSCGLVLIVAKKADGKPAAPTRGAIEIPYEDLDHLDRILARVFKIT